MQIKSPAIIDMEIDGIVFSVRPEKFEDFILGVDASRAMEDEDATNLMGACKAMMCRVVGWQGPVLEDGSPAPCTHENKDLLFGEHPDLLLKLLKRAQEREDELRKNSGASQDT